MSDFTAKFDPVRRVSRSGLSRIEVVILLLIVVFGCGLLLSGVAQIREAAARMTCSNNLKQMSVGIQDYHLSFNRLPPLTDQGEGAPTGKGIPSLFSTLIPYMESRAYYYHPEHDPPANYNAHSSVSFTYPDKSKDSGPTPPSRGGIANEALRQMVDPRDTTANQPSPLHDISMTLPDGSTGYYTTGSYVSNGLLPWNRKIPDSIPKGTENVIMLAERPQVCRTATGDTTYNLWGVGFYSPQMPTFATLTPTEPLGLWTTGQIAPVTPLPDENAPDRDALIRVKIGRADAAPGLPDFANPIQLIRPNQPCDPRLPGTPHTSGMLVAMADASVRGFTTNTTPWVFWSACTPTKP